MNLLKTASSTETRRYSNFSFRAFPVNSVPAFVCRLDSQVISNIFRFLLSVFNRQLVIPVFSVPPCLRVNIYGILIKCILTACLLLAFDQPLSAAGVDTDPVVSSDSGMALIAKGEFEHGLEQLQRAYQLFPLNAAYKHNLAEGYTAYGKYLLKLKRYEQADDIFVKAQELYPEEPLFSLMRGISNYHQKKYDVARYELDNARRLKPESVETLFFLGLVLYESDRRPEAVELWQQALSLAPGRHEIKEQLERARKEMAVENSMDRGHSSRFDLTYDPGVDTDFALAILGVLENASNQVGAELEFFPMARVPVVIYKRDDYKVVTASPDWSGGVYDGTIRLPFGAMKELTPQLRAILYHEYAHVVVYGLTRGNCPLWLNEGIAEVFGRRQYSQSEADVDRAARKKAYVDFSNLEGSFSGLGSADANLAYQQSFSLVNYLVSAYGWHRVSLILSGLGSGLNVKEAIARALQDFSLTYEALVQEWKESLEKGRAVK